MAVSINNNGLSGVVVKQSKILEKKQVQKLLSKMMVPYTSQGKMVLQKKLRQSSQQ
jgi:hypothetical protein